MRLPVSGVLFATIMDHNYAISPARVPTKQSNPATTNNIKPLTERQQMALLLQMTAETSPVSNSPNTTPKSLIRRNERGETPLHVAAIRGDLEKVRRLVRQGVDVNTTDFAGWSPLHEAANRGHTAIVRELLLAGASVNASGLDNVTPLHDAAVNGHDKIVNLLLRHGANANLTTSGNKTALDLAASPEIINLLAKGTAEVTDDDRSSEADENSPVLNRLASTPTNGTSTHTPWRVRTVNNPKQRKSRRNLIMDPTNAEALPVTDNTTELFADTLNLDVMESSNAGTAANTTEERESKLVASDSKALSNHEDVTSKEEVKEGEMAETPGQAQKRSLDAEEDIEEESKRKRKKGDEAKETKGGRTAAPRGKQTDRKSPNTVQTDSNHSIPESDEDGRKGNELKVPPLKIVLSSNTTEADTAGMRAKSSNGRGTLPYVVASNDEKAEGSASEKDEKPKDSLGDSEKAVSTGGRVTRSSQRAAATANNQATPTTSGPNSASQSPTCSPVQNASGNTNGSSTPPAPATENSETPAAPVPVANVTPAVTKEPVKVEDVKQEEQPVEVHPRKRKLRVKEPEPAPEPPTANQTLPQPEPVPQAPMSNPYDMYFSIRKQIERRHRNLIPVQPKPPQGFKDYLMNRCTYVIASNAAARLSVPVVSPPPTLPPPMRDLFAGQEKERYRLRMQHLIEKEKLVLSVEQEILRVHGRAARALANQSLPFSVCTLLKDQEVYSALTPEQEEKDRNARSRYNGRLFLSWLQDVDDKWEKIKDSMLLRHHNEAESLHAVQRMDWEWKLKDLALCDPQTKPVIEELHVPMVHVSDDFDLLPA